MKKNEFVEKYKHIEEEFFILDKENNIANISLEFNNPSEIFDLNYVTKTPILNDELTEWIYSIFELVPNRYKINLNICFDSLEGYKEEELLDIFKKNILLEYKKLINSQHRQRRIALSFLGSGILVLIITLLLTFLWKDGGVLKEVIAYILDVIVYVVMWEAVTILVVDSRERNFKIKNAIKRFNKITFSKMEK